MVAVLGDLNKGPDPDNPTRHPTLDALLGPDSPLVDAYRHEVRGLFDERTSRKRPGSFQSCTSPTGWTTSCSRRNWPNGHRGGVFRKGLWGDPKNINPPSRWESTRRSLSQNAASDHAAVWVDLDL